MLTLLAVAFTVLLGVFAGLILSGAPKWLRAASVALLLLLASLAVLLSAGVPVGPFNPPPEWKLPPVVEPPPEWEDPPPWERSPDWKPSPVGGVLSADAAVIA